MDAEGLTVTIIRQDMTTDTRDIMLELRKEGRVFRLFTEDDINQIAPHFKAYNFPEGSVVTKPGEQIDMMGIIVPERSLLRKKQNLKGTGSSLPA